MPSAALPAAASQVQPRAPAPAGSTRHYVPLLLAWIFGAAYIWIFLLRQWVPHDEGAFADMAARILRGEIPHRDYLDLYTGGLAYLHAFAWKIFGRDLAAFRYVLYAFALAWLPALYYIATRFVRPLIAAALVAVAVTWSIPNYPAAVPSWYNLFFATWGTAALLRYTENSQRRWLFVAGLCGGLSFLAQVSGLFFVFATVWFLVYRCQNASSENRSRIGISLRVVTIMIVGSAVARVVFGSFTARTVAYYIAPSMILTGLLLARELRCFRTRTGGSANQFLREMSVFAAGVLVPVAAFLLLYIHGGLADFVRGVFILPAKRMQFAQADPPPVWAIAVAAAVWAACAVVLSARRRVFVALSAAALFGLLLCAYWQDWALQSVWQSMSAAIPLIAIAAAAIVGKSERVFLLAAVTALCSLVQFPYSVPLYFCYVVPLVVLTIAALFATRLRASVAGTVVVLVFFAYAGVALLNPASIYTLADHYEHVTVNSHLTADGGQKIRMLPDQAALYNAIVSVIQQHTRGEFIYASPSAPEMYFLSGRRSPAPWTFDFFDDRSADPAFVSSMLEEHAVNAVVVNTQPDFDPAPTPEMMAMYSRLYPHAQRFGHFEVRWRE